MTVMQAIEKRRSVRSYQSRPVEDEKLKAVLEAGRLAPSSRNRQEWKFIVVQDESLRNGMVEACCGQGFVGEASAVLVVCATNMSTMTCGQPAQTIDAAIALSFMMLRAAELGLGTCWLGAFHADKVKEVLSLGEDIIPVAVSPLGYPAAMPEARPRKELEQITEFK